MKKLLFLFLLAALIAAPAAGQRRKTAVAKTPAVPVAERVEQALADYDFETAESLLTQEIGQLKRKKQDTSKQEEQLQKARQGSIRLHATERIVVIDSVVCKAADALRVIKLSAEGGRIDTYASTYHTDDKYGGTIYENDFANKRYMAVAAAKGQADKQLRLAVSDKIGNEWSAPTPLAGLNEDDISQNYPFLLSDGITLYYAAKGPECIGGYDIFVTRADGDDGSCLTPENVGFPYNSEANDYLLVIDEFAQLGWFVSDRRQPEGKVCVYTFIPNATRQSLADADDKLLRRLAKLTSIRDTWGATDKATLESARQRMLALRFNNTTKQSSENTFAFVIDDARTYHSLSDFRSANARKLMQQWLQAEKNIDTDATMLERLRDNFSKATPAERRQMADTILRLEQTLYKQQETNKQLAKQIRNAEITNQL